MAYKITTEEQHMTKVCAQWTLKKLDGSQTEHALFRKRVICTNIDVIFNIVLGQ